MTARPGTHILLYDRDCGFCRWALERVLAWDRRRRLEPVAIQSDEGQRLLEAIPAERRLDSWHLALPSGEVLSGGAAAPPLAELLPGGRPLAALLRAFPGLTERVYRWVAGHRALLARLLGLGATALLLAALAGCGATGEAGADATLRVYVSVPLRGHSAAAGTAIVNGAKLALDDAGGEAGGIDVEATYMDDTGGTGRRARWDAVDVAGNARTATEDSTAIAYIGEFESGATRTSLPITNQAGLLQVSPASTAVDLVADQPGSAGRLYQPSGERTFGRVIPDDDVQRAAARSWSRRIGRPVAVTHAGVPPPDRDGDRFTSAAQDPSQLPASGQEFADAYERRYGERPDPYAAYGYEAMAVALDSIDRASTPTDRGAVVDAFFATADRSSVLGTYSIDDAGDTTLRAIAGYRVERGRAVFERALEAP